MKWQKKKPRTPCVFMTRTKYKDRFEYNIWRIEEIDGIGGNGYYLGWLDEEGNEWDDLADMNFDEYFIIEKNK